MDCDTVLLRMAEGEADWSSSIGLRARSRLRFRGAERRALDGRVRVCNFRLSAQPRP